MAVHPVLPSDSPHSVGIPEYLPLTRQGDIFHGSIPGLYAPCQRFVTALAGGHAWLGAVVVRYTFNV
jgi:hypothetical protein